jgi:hypothetical protein
MQETSMNRELYPTDWYDLSQFVKEANNWCCQSCGRQCRRPGEFFMGIEYELTVAHLDPYSYDGEIAQVASLCIGCHLRYDAPFGWIARQRNHRQRQWQAGQLSMAMSSH